MTDTRKLRAALALKGMTAGDLAEKIGLSRQSMSYKMNNLREFRVKEIAAIAEVLNLTLEEREAIFFAEEDAQNSTF